MTEDKYYKVLHNNKVFSVSSMGASPLLLQKLYFSASFAPHAAGHMTSYNLLGCINVNVYLYVRVNVHF